MLSQRSTKSRRRPILVGLGVLLVGGVFVANLLLPTYFNRTSAGPGDTSPPAAGVSVVVTKTALAVGTALNAQNLQLASYPANLVPSGAYTDISQLVGRYLDVSVPANSPLVPSLTVTNASTAGSVALTAAPLDIKSGNKVMSVPYDPVADGGGSIHRNDHIDILDAQGTFVFNNLRVIEVGGGSSGPPANVILLEVTPDQAQTLAKLLAAGDPLRYVLRAVSDYSSSPAP